MKSAAGAEESTHPRISATIISSRTLALMQSDTANLRLDRRRFLKLSLGSAAFAGVGMRPSTAFAYGTQGALYRSLVPEGATPAAKGIDAAWLASLRERETAEPVFTKSANQLRFIGMPVGGIGCGTLYLGGDGRLWLWDVWHKGGVGIRPRSRAYHHPNGSSATHNCQNGANYFAPIDVWAANPPADEKPFPFDQGFALRAVCDGVASVRTLDHHGFAEISFRGGYPLAKVTYADPACPLDVELTSHPVFIPLNTPDSALPATVMEYSLHNPGSLPVEVVLLGWMQNPVFLDSGLPAGLERVNRVRPGAGHAFMECGSAGTAASPFAYASDYDVFASFEGSGYDDWTTTGTAFGTAPVPVPPPNHTNADLRDVRGVGNQIVNSFLATGGSDVPTGTLTSPAFTVTKGYIHFLLGGGAVSGIQVRLIDAADFSQLRISTNASNSSTMKWRNWDVRDLAGRPVKIVVEDLSGGTWGQLDFDHVCFSDKVMPPEYVVFDDFERDSYAPWATTGTAFGSGPIPITDIPVYQGNVNGSGNRVVNSHASAPGGSTHEKDAKTGTLVSPVFTVTHGYLHFLQGGGSYTNETRVRLLRASDGAQLRIQTGNDNNAMTWRTWDLRDLRGQSVYLSVEDLRTGGWGNVGVDQFVFSTNPAAPTATTDPGNLVDRGTIGIAEIGADTGRVAAADNLSAAFPWLPGRSADTGGIGRTHTLAPGATANVRFVVTWHFANLPSGLPGSRREYANRFADAFAVADYLATDWQRLVGDTRAWIDTWKDSSLPHWFLDRCLSTAATLATANCFWFTSGRFYVLAQAKLNGNIVPATFTLHGTTLSCSFPTGLTLAPADMFQVTAYTSAAPAAADTDGDGLTDLEETSGFDDPGTTADPRGRLTNPDQPDSDGDGTSDGVEARLGTNPLSGAEFFQPLLTRDQDGHAVLTWPSSVGVSFHLMRSDDLLEWQAIATGIPGQPGQTTFTDTSVPVGTTNVFYRVGLD